MNLKMNAELNKKGFSSYRAKAFVYLMEMRGVEPLTSALRTQRSAKLSYIPVLNFKVQI